MTDLASALANGEGLPDYAGRKVVRTTVSIRNAGDGLSEGLGIDPQVLPLGEEVYVVLKCTVHAHDHDRILDKGTDTGLLVLDQVLKASAGTLIDADLVREAIAEQEEKIKVAREKAKGISRLPGDDPIEQEHVRGEHAPERRDDCFLCQEELAAEEREAKGEPEPEPAPVAPIGGRRRVKDSPQA